MIEKYCGGVVPESHGEDEFDKDLKAVATGAAAKVESADGQICFQYGAGGNLGAG